jgi:hypothetical protein
MGAAIPFIPMAVSGVGGFLAKKFGLGGPSKQEQALNQQQAGNAAQLNEQGTGMFKYGNPLLQQSTSYYQRLLNGNRAAMTQAVQPEIAGITDTYRGAERGLERSGIRGPARDVASAELTRDRAGKVASLIPNVRPMAAAAVGDAGRFGIQQGQAAQQASSGIYDRLISGGREDRKSQNETQGAFGKTLGTMTADAMKAFGKKSSKGAGA